MSTTGQNYTYQLLLNRSSFSGDATVTTDYAGDTIARGKGFEVSTVITIAIGATADVILNYAAYTDTTDRQGVIVITPPYFSSTAGPVVISVRRDPVFTAGTGTAIRTIRKNTLIENYPQVEWLLNPTITDIGADPFEYLVGTQGRGNNPGGGASTAGAPFFRGNSSATLVRIDNQSGAEIQFYYNQVWYEI